MIGWLIFMVVDKLKSTVTEWATGWTTERLVEEVTLVKEVETELNNMKSKMEHIQTVLADAENRSVKDKLVKIWLGNLQDVFYDMEDVLDEWNTRVLILEREEAEKSNTSNEIVGSSSSSSSSEASETSSEAEENTSNEIVGSSSWLPFNQLNDISSSVKQVPWRRDIALRIKDINQRINELFKEMERFQMVSKAVTNDDFSKINNYNDITRTTTPFIDESEVYGRVRDKTILLSKVLSVNTEQEKSLQVVSIVGPGGLGKTTLAQLVYNDEKVKEKFGKKRIWVCVSNPFNEVKVAQAILEGLQVGHTEMKNLPNLHQSIAKSLNKNTFLLVLDDVWDEDFGKWKRLSLTLKVGDPDSRILVTTRKEEVVRTVGTTQSNILKPQLISDSDCWMIMKQRALQGRTNMENDELEKIGEDIAKKCKGLPLAAKTLGGLLRSTDSIEEWKEVLKSEIWELEKVEVDLFPHIFLSYQELPSLLKRCFLILALFPKDTKLNVEEVIYHWMTYGYLNRKIERDDIVKTGQKYLKFLVSRAFLEENKFGVAMHDIMHDFALYLLGDELVSIMVEDDTESGSTSESTSKRARKSTKALHLVINGNINPTPTDPYLRKLRTCILFEVPPYVTSNLVKQLKMVRKLNLQNCDLEQVPESIENLIHLRMLVLSDNPLVELPETIGNLYNLQNLFLEGIGNLSSLPHSLGKLVNLISLTPTNLAIEKVPESLEKLINLQSLGRLRIKAGKSHLGLLKDLNQLRGELKIEFKSDYDDELDAKKAAIGGKKHLTRLELYFNDYNVKNGVVAALQPHPYIQRLEIRGLLPGWITSLHHLKDLEVSFADISTLPPLWKLESLENVFIWNCHSLKTISREFLGIDSSPTKKLCAFPKLVKLIFFCCEGLTGFEDLKPEDEGEITVMPNLEILKIEECYQFGKIPIRLLRQVSSLKEVDIKGCGFSLELNVKVIDEGVAGNVYLSQRYVELKTRVKSSIQVPVAMINHTYITLLELYLQTEPISFLPPMGNLPYLERLTIEDFGSLKFIGREFLGIDNEEFVAFPNLLRLEIYRCDLLERWEDLKPEDKGKITVMPKLEVLQIEYCPKFKLMPPRLLSQLSPTLKVTFTYQDDKSPRRWKMGV